MNYISVKLILKNIYQRLMSQKDPEKLNSRERNTFFFFSLFSGDWVFFSTLELFALFGYKQRDFVVGRRKQGVFISHVG